MKTWALMPIWGSTLMTVDKRANKKTGEELQMYLAFRKRAFNVPQKKGKGSYKRATFKKGL